MRVRLAAIVVIALVAGRLAAAEENEHAGQVTFGGLPVPGAAITATRAARQVSTVSDADGFYRLAGLAAGVWAVRIEMLGFIPIAEEISIPADHPARVWVMQLEPVGRVLERARSLSVLRPVQPAGGSAVPIDADPFGGEPPDETGIGAAQGFLINGSVNNAAVSPFAQSRAFGNNRPGGRSLYTGSGGLRLGSSALDARPFSFAGRPSPKPSYTDVEILGTIGGPLRIPGVLRNGPIFFAGYQRRLDNRATTRSALVPTLAERSGDFSAGRGRAGQPASIVDPATGGPFAGSTIPADRISPQAASLLALYPLPNLEAGGRFNYQAPTLEVMTRDSVQSRLTQRVDNRNTLFSTVAYERTATETTGLFGFTDRGGETKLDAAANWAHRLTPWFSVRMRYELARETGRTVPHFSERTNVAGEAGIRGGDQSPRNWGPPALVFSSGLAGLGGVQYGTYRGLTHKWSAETFWYRSRHNLTIGGGVRRLREEVFGQQDARGTFAFTGAATGSDLADFLLGLPQTGSIAFGNADKSFGAPAYEAYLNDDWRVTPAFTLNLGVRWEHEAPFTERLGRLVNLDIAEGFAAAAPVLAGDPIGPLTGRRFPASLVAPDRSGLQPRLGLAWRPVPGSSLVVRAGYGIYRNTDVYRALALLLAQQPPLSTAFSVANTPATPLTLADGLATAASAASNTFAVDPAFRVGFVQNWQLSAQRDLPGSLTVIATYLGAKGSRLMQAFLPNTYPDGALNPCPACPAGFVYLTSSGSSSRHAGQLQLRRRLRNGLTATAQYTLAKADDDASAFDGSMLTGAAIVQDWLNPAAERGPSSFDQRHQFTLQFEFTTGVGTAGGGLLDGLTGAFVRNWIFTAQLTAGSGLPQNPVYLSAVTGTGFTGTVRPDRVSGAGAIPADLYADPAGFAAPPAGRWGNAGRNSIVGPAQFELNAGLGRAFPWGDRLEVDWRIEAVNVLNRVTWAGINTIVGSPQFGLPDRTIAMRKLQASVRVRF